VLAGDCTRTRKTRAAALATLSELAQAPAGVATLDCRLRRFDGVWVGLRAFLRAQVRAGVTQSFCGVAVVLSGPPELERLEAHNEALIAALPTCCSRWTPKGWFSTCARRPKRRRL
jgi:hypothetical protein